MKLYKHRCNTFADLDAASVDFGIEVDVRSHAGELIVSHDPFNVGIKFETWIHGYHHRGLILNVKEDGLEEKLIEIMMERMIDNYLFLDQSYPTMIKWLKNGYTNHVAARISEHESIESVKSLPSIPRYFWCDSFTGDWTHLYKLLDYANAVDSETILVSPELQGRVNMDEVETIKEIIEEIEFKNIGICTKHPELWL